ncbi:hypothetical protein CVS30_04940 [Arthrobacter psychrolactophilus]|uniref:Uncharacterized protein n=1 Tax=Arthrobacter psychrolactophilus TaxID=92442 RepID=A0A2V5IY96_9MICC|nr:hypothetical protein [Arthrobacter psychrolactophilus]PYI39314.1 hypothetical protein CVS30_04940 [Arthrobacter psychrolactophilus]
MNTAIKNNAYYANRVMWIGFSIALTTMVALFIAGVVIGNAGMAVMASSTGALLGAAATATHKVINKAK